jgi:hypothetical protein
MEFPLVDTDIEGEEEPVSIDDNKNKDTTIVWDEPPIPPDPDMVMNDSSCQGTIATSLRDALCELQQYVTLKSIEQQYNFQFDINEIIHSFSESIVQNQQDQHIEQKMCSSQQQQIQDVGKNNNIAPAALLRGTIHHYNRYGTKWRFIVKNVEIIPRLALSKYRRNKRQRTSLYTITESTLLQQQQQQQQQSSSSSSSVSIKIPQLEILVYNDIE